MQTVRGLLITAAAALAAACALRPPPPLRTTKLVIETTSGGGLRPFVRATVAGAPVRLLLDTGTFQSVLPARFAREHRLPRRTSAANLHMVDVNGRRTEVPYLPDVPVQFEGESTGGTIDFLMNPSLEADEAILAPHELVRPGTALVIDLAREEVGYEPEEAALGRLREGSSLRKVEFRRCLDEGLFNRAHRLVSMTINGVRARMLIDTGAERTTLARNNPALPSMLSAQGVRGGSVGVTSVGHGILADEVPIEFAATAFLLPVLVVPASNPCWDGAVGTDVLRHCTIVWGWDDLWVGCRAPAPNPP
jgi:hypothetical protein